MNPVQKKVLPLDFRLEEELRRNDAMQITAAHLDVMSQGPTGAVMERVLAELGLYASGITAANSLIGKAMATRDIATGYVPPGGLTLDFLAILPDDYFGRHVTIIQAGLPMPFSLARDGNDIYVRCHMSKEEAEANISNPSPK